MIVGLGNPGSKYRFTRHNIGQMVIEKMASEIGITLKNEKRFFSDVASGIIFGKKVTLLFPKTYMNESGTAVRRYLDYFQCPIKNVIVVCDDVDLPFGMMRLREKGSSGGHNGLKSIETHLNTREYTRLRMGIGSKGLYGDLADYVLSKMSSKEQQKLSEFISDAVSVIKRLFQEPIKDIMNDVNKKVQNNETNSLNQ